MVDEPVPAAAAPSEAGGPVSPLGAGRAAPLVRGFLFADLRDYTAFVEQRGDSVAGDLLDRYRSLVRRVLAGHGGHEVKTEGDSFYVVFDSVTDAVTAGLDLVAMAATETTEHPELPIRVGVGIHAGEAAERAEGYVGSAVNIAARVCAVAAAGEVLVTDTVRLLSRTSGDVTYRPRGRRALKGIDEPMALFAAGRGPVERTTRSRASLRRVGGRWRAALTGLAIVAVVVVLFAVAATAGLGTAAPSTSPSAGQSVRPSAGSPSEVGAASPIPAPSGAQPFHTGRLAAGSYVTSVYEPKIGFTLPDGWNGTAEIPNYLEMQPFGVDDEGIGILTPSVGYVPCSTTEYTPLPAKREDLVDWLRTHPGLDVDLAGSLTLGSVEAIELDIGLGDGCDGATVQPLFLIRKLAGFTDPDDRWVITPGPKTPTYLIDVAGRTVVVLIAAPPSRIDAFAKDAKAVLSSLEVAH